MARSSVPKVYVPNADGVDPEGIGLGLPEKGAHLLTCLERGAAKGVKAEDVLHLVLVDVEACRIPRTLLAGVERQSEALLSLS